MAYGNFDFFSDCLKRTVSFRIVLPNENLKNEEKLNVLYLLHGYNGISSDWMLNSSILEIASQKQICIVLPTGENSFYLNQAATGREYASFVGKELPDYICQTFPVTASREGTFIGGFSMGGFGALHTALAFPERFGKTFALSSALIVNEVKQMKPGYGNEIANYEYYKMTFGEPTMLDNSVNNPEYLVKELINSKQTIPDIYMACGTEDFLLQPNREFADFLKRNEVRFTYKEGPGNHNFDFWSNYLIDAVSWIFEERE